MARTNLILQGSDCFAYHLAIFGYRKNHSNIIIKKNWRKITNRYETLPESKAGGGLKMH